MILSVRNKRAEKIRQSKLGMQKQTVINQVGKKQKSNQGEEEEKKRSLLPDFLLLSTLFMQYKKDDLFHKTQQHFMRFESEIGYSLKSNLDICNF